MSKRSVHKLLTLLFDFADGGSKLFDFPKTGEDYRDADGEVLLRVDARTKRYDLDRLRPITRESLANIAVDESTAMDMLEAQINGHGGLRFQLWSPIEAGRTWKAGRVVRGDSVGPARLVLTNFRDEWLPVEILGLARVTPTGQGDAVADRIAQCRECQKFFLLKTRKPSKYCGTRCRWKATNLEKVKAGKFRESYQRRRNRQKLKQNPKPRSPRKR